MKFNKIAGLGALILMVYSISCSPKKDPPKKAEIAFVGDLMSHRMLYHHAKKKEGIDYLQYFVEVTNHLKRPDMTIGNLEMVVSTNSNVSFYPRYNAPKEYLEALKEAGFDMLTTANNHCCDKGIQGMKDTLSLMESLGMASCGSSHSTNSTERIHFREINGVKIGFISYSYGFNLLPSGGRANLARFGVFHRRDLSGIKKDIEFAKPKSDFVILLLHWGEEYTRKTHKKVKESAYQIMDLGADAIIGTHPHVLQPVEHYTSKDGRECFVAYSLGNFLAYYADPPGKQGVIFHVSLEKEGRKKRIYPSKKILTFVDYRKEMGEKRGKIRIREIAEIIKEYEHSNPLKARGFRLQEEYMDALLSGREPERDALMYMDSNLAKMRDRSNEYRRKFLAEMSKK